MIKARKSHRLTKRRSRQMVKERRQMVPHPEPQPQRRWTTRPKSPKRLSTATLVELTVPGFASTMPSMTHRLQAQQLQRSSTIYVQIATSRQGCQAPIGHRTLSSWRNLHTAQYQIETHRGPTLRPYSSWK